MCQCDCGNKITVDGVNLKRGLTKSCGCNKFTSYAVQEIEKILKENNISYQREKAINLNGVTYFIDFEIKYQNQTYYLEYDGEQHFHSGSESGWNTIENLRKTHLRDKNKNQYCFIHNIPLIRIPYDHKTLTLKDLLLSTSSWILTEKNQENYYKNRI